MKIISINMNKGLNNDNKRLKIEKLIEKFDCNLLIVQEPWKNSQNLRVEFSGFRFLEGNHQTAAWYSETDKSPSVFRHTDRWLELIFPKFSIHNVYVPDEPNPRSEMLKNLANYFKTPKPPSLICGDFNMAPQPEDGIKPNGEISTFTKPGHRESFNSLLFNANLVDTTCENQTGKPREFTIERTNQFGVTKHRCDLALIHNSLYISNSVKYNHSVRIKEAEGGLGITDHSAVIIELSI